MIRYLCFYLLFSLILANGCQQDEWISIFDGKSLDGWEASENKDSWKVDDGSLITSGPRSHLYYSGDISDHDFKNFEFMADVKTTPDLIQVSIFILNIRRRAGLLKDTNAR